MCSKKPLLVVDKGWRFASPFGLPTSPGHLQQIRVGWVMDEAPKNISGPIRFADPFPHHVNLSFQI
jgi:hypothetical protein